MNILVSTTFGHNCGDDTLRLGAERVVRDLYPDAQFFYYDRCPDNQEGGRRTLRPNLVGNYYRQEAELLDFMDLVVLAGSPEWYGGPMEALYSAIKATNPNIPLLAIGIGFGEPHSQLTVLDVEVLERPETKIITRSHETTSRLATIGIKSETLPCPAILAYGFHLEKTKDVLLIAQCPLPGWHGIKEEVLVGLEEWVQAGADLLCIHVKEFEWFAKRGYKPLYCADALAFKNIVKDYSYVASTRLHGAIGAMSLGATASIVTSGDYRIETCAKVYGAKLPVYKDFSNAGCDVRTRPLVDKKSIFNAYLRALRV